MKVQFFKRRNRALTILEVLVILAIIAFMAILIYPGEGPDGKRAQRIGCVLHLNEISVATQIWDDDSRTNTFVSTTNGVRAGWLVSGKVADWFQVLSNELIAPKTFICPADSDHVSATNFQNDFNNSHISYFVSPDANKRHRQTIQFGDDNLEITNAPVKSGLLGLAINTAISWTAARHNHAGNVAFADGSVSEVSDTGLQEAIIQTGVATNRFAIP